MLPVTFGECSHQSTKHHQIHLQPLLLGLHLRVKLTRGGSFYGSSTNPSLTYPPKQNKGVIAGLIKGTPMVNKTLIRPYFWGRRGCMLRGWVDWHVMIEILDSPLFLFIISTWILQSGVKLVLQKTTTKQGDQAAEMSYPWTISVYHIYLLYTFYNIYILYL